MKRLEFHPMLKDVPMMPLHERDALGADIEKHGQEFPIRTWQGKIIDGRNRYLAMIARGLEPKVLPLDRTNAKAFVASVNYFRKHWTTQERSHFAAIMSLESEAGNPDTKGATPLNGSNELITSVEPVITQTEAAKQMGVSVASVKRARRRIKGKTNSKQSQVGAGVGEPVDDYGCVVPTSARPYWNRKPEARNVLNQISAARGQVKKLVPDDPMWANVNLNGVIADLNSAYNRFAAAIPAYVCPYCSGVKVDGCKCCKGKGVVSKFVWSTIPKAITEAGKYPF